MINALVLIYEEATYAVRGLKFKLFAINEYASLFILKALAVIFCLVKLSRTSCELANIDILPPISHDGNSCAMLTKSVIVPWIYDI